MATGKRTPQPDLGVVVRLGKLAEDRKTGRISKADFKKQKSQVLSSQEENVKHVKRRSSLPKPSTQKAPGKLSYDEKRRRNEERVKAAEKKALAKTKKRGSLKVSLKLKGSPRKSPPAAARKSYLSIASKHSPRPVSPPAASTPGRGRLRLPEWLQVSGFKAGSPWNGMYNKCKVSALTGISWMKLVKHPSDNSMVIYKTGPNDSWCLGYKNQSRIVAKGSRISLLPHSSMENQWRMNCKKFDTIMVTPVATTRNSQE